MIQNWKFQRGDIFFTRFDNAIGSEQSGNRPAVVLQNDVGNFYSPTLIVATLTSKAAKKYTQPTHCLLVNDFLSVPSIVQTEQIFTVDKSRVLKFLGHLTPEEMSRLSGRTIQEIQHEIADTALKCAAETGSVCVLKDACTVIADEKGQMYLNLSGNSGMATAGSGDVLSGILAAVLCMYLKTEEQPPMVLKAALGVYLHGLCGDLAAAEKGKRSMLAGDIIEYLPRALAIGEEESEL